MTMDRIDRYRGCLLGLATGDALGTALEFRPRGTFAPVIGMVVGGFHNLKPGAWTDDTSLALCLAESLTEKRGFDPIDQLERYSRWYLEGTSPVRDGASISGRRPGRRSSGSCSPGNPFPG